MVEVAVDILTWACFLVGGFFLLIGALGMIRLPDFWARLHAASIVDSAGVGLLLLGMMLQGGWTFVTIKLVLIVLFLLITGPTATHAVANAAFVSGSRSNSLVEDVTQGGTKAVFAETKPKSTRQAATKTGTTAKQTKRKTASKPAKSTVKKGKV